MTSQNLLPGVSYWVIHLNTPYVGVNFRIPTNSIQTLLVCHHREVASELQHVSQPLPNVLYWVITVKCMESKETELHNGKKGRPLNESILSASTYL